MFNSSIAAILVYHLLPYGHTTRPSNRKTPELPEHDQDIAATELYGVLADFLHFLDGNFMGLKAPRSDLSNKLTTRPMIEALDAGFPPAKHYRRYSIDATHSLPRRTRKGLDRHLRGPRPPR